jgi:ATP-dependent DNA helicase RecG
LQNLINRRTFALFGHPDPAHNRYRRGEVDLAVLEIPEDALREAVVNAVCHRDYFEKGARVMVEIFDDRVDIVSPGGVCKGVTLNNFGTISITRNSTLATLLHRSHYIEQMGTGIRRMRNATREAQVAEPEFELTGFFKVTFKRNPIDISIGRQSTANRLQSATTTDRKSKIILFLEEHHQATVSDFISIIGLSKGRVRDVLRDMVSDGTIEKIGDKRYAYYVLKS